MFDRTDVAGEIQMIKKESGIYAFTSFDYKAGVFILITGKCENKLNRLSDYRVTNANTEFDFFLSVPLNQLLKKEREFQKQLKQIYPTWKNSPEQFVLGESKSDLNNAIRILEEDIKMPVNKTSPQKLHEYHRATLDGEVVDSRDFRPMCGFIPGQVAHLKGKVNEPNRFRTRKTFATFDGNKIIEHDTEQTVYMSASAHNMDRLIKYDQRIREKRNTPQDNGFIA
jgi:hypothetical protein